MGAGVGRAAVPLFVIPTETALAVMPDPTGPLDIDIYVQDVTGFARLLAVPATALSADHFRYRVGGGYLQLESPAARTWTESTFVIDYRERSVRQAFAAWKKAAPRDRSGQSLVRFVSEFIHESYGRGFDIASTVAQRREGDCTEHAVLTVALARMAKIPARVVFGVALVRGPKHVAGFGHAWAEVREVDHWVIADAALTNVPDVVSYLPSGVMEDEGLGFSAGLVNRLTRWVEKIVIVGPAPAVQ
jgi:hypothetical protein